MASRHTTTLDPIACCAPVRTDVLDEVQATMLANSFAALSDPIRLRLLSCIAASGRMRCARAIWSSRLAARSQRSATT